MACEWLPIDKLEPVLWTRYVVAWPDGYWGVVMWKTNRRWPERDDPSLSPDERKFVAAHPQPYFGDENEMDDYDMAQPENRPIFYLPFDAPQVEKR